MDWFNPSTTYVVLLVVQALHVLHHRLAKQHISFAEVLSSSVLVFHPAALPAVPGLVFMTAHLLLAAVQTVGSLFIRRLSPRWAPDLAP